MGSNDATILSRLVALRKREVYLQVQLDQDRVMIELTDKSLDSVRREISELRSKL